MAGGKFTNYAESFGVNMEAVFNRAITRTVEAGFKTLLQTTIADSGRSLYHWNLIPGNKSGLSPGARRIAKFDFEVRGKGVVGNRGDKGASRRSIEQHVLTREINQVLRRGLAGGRQAVGRGTTTFAFYNPTPDTLGAGQNDANNAEAYAVAANLAAAEATAINEMRNALERMLTRENGRNVRARFK